MKKTRSHFWYTKHQRNGIFCLLLIMLILQASYYIAKNFSDTEFKVAPPIIENLERQYDSIQALKSQQRINKIFPFNPNYINDYKGYRLGMSVDEIDRLLNYRKRGRFVNSKEEFQTITKVSDSLLQKISPYFKFPDWVVEKQKELHRRKQYVAKSGNKNRTEENRTNKITTRDINKATAKDFRSIKGIGEVLSERIIRYRTKLQGFYFDDQLYEVWHLDSLVAKRTLTVFKVFQKPSIKKINVNTATFKQVLAIPYIDYHLCKKIFEYRDEVAELQNIEELKNIEGFPLEKYNRIVVYLLAQ